VQHERRYLRERGVFRFKGLDELPLFSETVEDLEDGLHVLGRTVGGTSSAVLEANDAVFVDDESRRPIGNPPELEGDPVGGTDRGPGDEEEGVVTLARVHPVVLGGGDHQALCPPLLEPRLRIAQLRELVPASRSTEALDNEDQDDRLLP